MKKLFAAILALGLIMAVSGTASAVDVKLSGSYYVTGVYESNSELKDTDNTYSRAFFYQRIRLEPVFKIAEGLTFTARINAMEKQWGDTTFGSTDNQTDRTNPNYNSNFNWDRGYVTFLTKVGMFEVGYRQAYKWGADFGGLTGSADDSYPSILYAIKYGPVTAGAQYIKLFESDNNKNLGGLVSKKADADADQYDFFAVYNFKGGEAGLLYDYIRHAEPRPVPAILGGQYQANINILQPYFKATFGSVYVESEVNYVFGKEKSYDIAKPDVDIDSWAAYLMMKTNLGPATIGAQIGWAQGDDKSDPTTVKDIAAGGRDWNPALILMNDDLAVWKGRVDASSLNSVKTNFILYNVFADYRVTPKFSMGAAFTYAKNDKPQQAAGVEYVSKDLGYELDVTAKYKLYDNLSYMVGAGYLWTGDAFKGTNSANVVDNDYILMNKLSLTF